MLEDDGVESVDGLLASIEGKARGQRPLPAVVDAGRFRAAEDRLGFSLPPFLAALYLKVADGGFGPGGDVSIPGYSVGFLHPLDTAVQAYQDNRRHDPELPYSPWTEGVLPMLYWGCFAEAAVDCLNPDGPVLVFEADVDEVAPDQAWKIQSSRCGGGRGFPANCPRR